MYNQTESILSQYELEIKQIIKGRGTYICDTDRGRKTLVAFRGSPERGGALRAYLEQIGVCGFFIEQITLNRDGQSVTTDEVTGERFVLKDYFCGAEMNPLSKEDVTAASRLLGEYHSMAITVSQMDCVGILMRNQPMLDVKRRHYKELVKIRNYIKNKKKKNDFERGFLEPSDALIQTAADSLAILEQCEWSAMDMCVCHGDYNQHNVIRQDGHMRIVNYENAYLGLPMEDLANYMRKILEKNQWDVELGKSILNMYQEKRNISDEEACLLYGLLLFPERFWKITNHYMNSHKAWVSGRDIEKQKKVVEQEQYRIKFLENLFSF